MGSVTPFHYTGVLQEVSSGLHHVLQAQDWKEAIGEAADAMPLMRFQNERGNLRAAIARLQGAYLALQKRVDELALEIQPAENKAMEEAAPGIATAIRAADDSHLPPELRGKNSGD